MSVSKVTISIESGLLRRLDHLVKSRVFSNRNQASQAAVEEKAARTGTMVAVALTSRQPRAGFPLALELPD
jgi:metal-responsive CopG/Arc/MetJ family transcriptional regulator